MTKDRKLSAEAAIARDHLFSALDDYEIARRQVNRLAHASWTKTEAELPKLREGIVVQARGVDHALKSFLATILRDAQGSIGEIRRWGRTDNDETVELTEEQAKALLRATYSTTPEEKRWIEIPIAKGGAAHKVVAFTDAPDVVAIRALMRELDEVRERADKQAAEHLATKKKAWAAAYFAEFVRLRAKAGELRTRAWAPPKTKAKAAARAAA